MYEHKDGDKNITEEYSSDTKNFYVVEYFDNYKIKYVYSLDVENLAVQISENEKLQKSFIYSVKAEKCLNGECDLEKVNDFINNCFEKLMEN